MSNAKWILLVSVLIGINVSWGLYILIKDTPEPLSSEFSPSVPTDEIAQRIKSLEETLFKLQHELAATKATKESLEDALQNSSSEKATEGEASTVTDTQVQAISQRIAQVEKSMGALKKEMNEKVFVLLGGNDKIDFTAEDGYVHATRLAEAGKHNAAAEGYMKFLEKFPDHVDARDIAKKARANFMKAGFKQRAIDIQKDIIEAYPDYNEEDYSTLARMYFDMKHYDEAIENVTKSIDLMQPGNDQLWKMMYRAWYIELGRPPEEGIAAYEEVDRRRAELGIENKQMKDKVQKYIQRIRNRMKG